MLAPPSLQQRSRELLIGRDILRLVVRSPTLRSLPRGDGGPVLLVPGFGATDASLLPLRRLLASLGHDARPIRLGRMGDDIRALADRTIARAIDVHDETGRRPALVGWSIGGVVSREAARDRPDMIRRVVTFGSPTVGGPSYTALAGRYKPAELAAIRAEIDDRNRTPIAVPVTAIWSPNDGVVSPEACIDQVTPGAENLRVTSTHIGLGVDPNVWTIVAERLAR